MSSNPAADDRGLAYGDGVFETLAARDGRPLAPERHLARLRRGCEALGFPAPDDERLAAALVAAAAPAGASVVKLIVTRGRGGRGYRPPAVAQPEIHVSSSPWPDGMDAARRDGVAVRRLEHRMGENPALAGLKHLNRLDQVLAAAELARHPGAGEGIVCDQSGRPVCGVMSNLFLVRGGELVTPALRRCGVDGIIRCALLELSRAGALPPAAVRDVGDAELDDADEMFVTNSVRGLLPVRSLDGGGERAPGPVTRQAQAALADAGLVA